MNENKTTLNLQDKLTRLELENNKLRKSQRRWRQRFEQEMNVNKELGRRIRALKKENTKLKSEIESLAKLPPMLMSNELENDSPARKAPQLFNCFLIVDGREGEVKFRFNAIRGKTEQLQRIEEFCFAQHESIQNQMYVFVIGDNSAPGSSGKLSSFSCLDNVLFGICARSEVSNDVHCFLTERPLLEVFQSLLRHSSCLATQPEIEEFCQSIVHLEMKPNMRFTLSGIKHSEWTWPDPSVNAMSLLESWGLSSLLGSALALDHVLFTIGCLMLELKVVLVSKDLSLLSSASFGFLLLLSPCKWVQPYIPLLPSNLTIVCDAPVPVFVGITERPCALEEQDLETEPPTPDAEHPAFSCHDNGRQESLIVDLDEGCIELSKALSTSFHALKLPGLTSICHNFDLEGLKNSSEQQRAFQTSVKKQIAGVLEACYKFGNSTATLAVSNSLPKHVLNEAGLMLRKTVPMLDEPAPWHFLARLHSTQVFMQWVDESHAILENSKSFNLTSLLSPGQS